MKYFFRFAFSLAAFGVVSTQLNTESNNVTRCPERYSCLNTASDSDETFCKCDPLCEVYDDCCDDYVRNSSGHHRNRFKLQQDVITCKSLGFYDIGHHFVVDRCPKDFERGYVERQCRMRRTRANNTIVEFPVFGRHSKILYRNVYCATCNGEQDVVFWKGEGKIANQWKGRLHTTDTSDLQIMEYVPPVGYSVRTCINVIRKCQKNYRIRSVMERCTNTSQSNLYVYARSRHYPNSGDVYYRNVDCAKCNFKRESWQMCQFDEGVDGQRYDVPMPDFSHIINIEIGNATIEVTGISEFNLGIRKENRGIQTFQCRSNQVYDHKLKKCRSVLCQPPKKLKASRCVAQ